LGYEALKVSSQPLVPVWRFYAHRFNPGNVLFAGESLLEGVTLVNDLPKAFRGLRVEISVRDPKGRSLWKEKGTCNLPADSIVKPFKPQMRWNHIKEFRLPSGIRMGVWKVEVLVRDRSGKRIAFNSEDFQVLPKR
jgi:hypothetical protein